MTTSPEGRDYAQLLEAMNELLAVLASEAGEEAAALRASFTASARGSAPARSCCWWVEQREPLRLSCVLFLDEVSEMAPAVQVKLLCVLQERELQRLGSAKTLKTDVQVIAATNRDPRLVMERGVLREDLYYRLSVFEIPLPPLRARPEDILVLAEAFLEEIGKAVGRPAGGISEDARDQLLAHPWPCNVRELRNAIERAVILCEGGLVTGLVLAP